MECVHPCFLGSPVPELDAGRLHRHAGLGLGKCLWAHQALDALDTADVYEFIERHRAAATVVTSNRGPIEWLGYMADPLLAQSAIDRLQSVAHELVLDGDSYRQTLEAHRHRRA